VADQVRADLADALDADPAAVQRRAAPGVLRRGPHRLVDAERGQHGAVAGAAVLGGAPGGEPGLAGDDVHVLHVGADVAGRVVAAGERLDEAAVGAQQRLGLVGGRVAEDDRLAAAEVEAGAGRLVGHRAGELEDVLEGVGLRGVRVEARAAERRAERRAVDRDDRPEAAGRVLAEDHLLVTGVLEVVGAVEDATAVAPEVRPHVVVERCPATPS
jgi:hypothetical protein